MVCELVCSADVGVVWVPAMQPDAITTKTSIRTRILLILTTGLLTARKYKYLTIASSEFETK
ncbi:hypothetical protein JCM16307_19420 [Thermococcus prieurii]